MKTPTELRLAELMAAISLAIDLDDGYLLEKGLRDAILAVGLAREIGLDGQDLSDVYHTALLEQLGCTGHAHELAAVIGGDEQHRLRDDLAEEHGPDLVRGALLEPLRA